MALQARIRICSLKLMLCRKKRFAKLEFITGIQWSYSARHCIRKKDFRGPGFGIVYRPAGRDVRCAIDFFNVSENLPLQLIAPQIHVCPWQSKLVG